MNIDFWDAETERIKSTQWLKGFVAGVLCTILTFAVIGIIWATC